MADPFFKDLAFAALAQTARNPTRDFLQATPRNPILGYLSDLAASSYSPERTQQMQGVAQFMGAPAISETLNRLSYGEPLTTGAGGIGGTTRIRPEALEAAMTLAPMVAPTARMAGAGAMAAGRAGERFAERAVPMVMERGGFGSELLQGMSRGTVSPMDVYHGSPHRFERFDASKIGTGEGAQAYGHGLYFAESPEVAKNYTGAGGVSKASETMLRGRAEKVLKNPEAHAASDVEWAGKTLNQLNSRVGNQLYKVDLPDDQIAKMLDWDKPLSEQPNAVKALRSIADRVPGLSDALQPFELGSTTGRTVNDYISRALSPEDAARLFKDAGIPGIKYLDEGSRNLANTWIVRHPQGGENVFSSKASAEAYLKRNPEETLIEPKVTRNFVTFPGNESMLTILERNRQPLALKAEETWAGFATPEQYNAAKFYGQNETERWPAAWKRAGAVAPEEILRGKGIVQPPPTQRDKDLYLLESRFSGFMDASKARQFLENDMLKATKKEKDLLRKYYDASGKFIPRQELPVQQAMQEFEQGLTNFMATR